MSIDDSSAQKALKFLRDAAMDMEDLVLQAREAARIVKYKIALAIVRMGNANTVEKVPATLRKDYALADPEVQEAIKEADKAEALLIGINTQCDAAKTTISVYQTMVKDRS